MLSFHDYIQESRLQQLRKQIALNLILYGKTLPEVMEELLSSRQIHNELFGGFIRRLGAAWNAFWHGGSDNTLDAEEVLAAVQKMQQNYENQIAQLQAALKKGGMDGREIETALYKIREQLGGQYYDFMKGVREKQVEAKGYKPDGIMQKVMAVLEQLQSVSQDPRIDDKTRVGGIEKIGQALTALRQEAEKQLKAATDEADKKEAQAAIEHIDHPELKKILDGLRRLRDEIQFKLKKGNMPALDGDDPIEKGMRARSGEESPSSLPTDPRQAFEALKSWPGPKNEPLQRWWDAMSDDQKVEMHKKLGIPWKIEHVTGSNLRQALQNAVNAGKI